MTRNEYLVKVRPIAEGLLIPEHLPATAPIVAMFAERYMPVIPPADSPDNMTSYEIAEALEDVCALSVTDVALVMQHLGYRLHLNGYRGYEWAMAVYDPND